MEKAICRRFISSAWDAETPVVKRSKFHILDVGNLIYGKDEGGNIPLKP